MGLIRKSLDESISKKQTMLQHVSIGARAGSWTHADQQTYSLKIII
jgi:hypothetical protein